jgi:hypothetical protein
MRRRVAVVPDQPVAELHARYRQTDDPVERTHSQIIWLAAGGHSVSDLARLVG